MKMSGSRRIFSEYTRYEEARNDFKIDNICCDADRARQRPGSCAAAYLSGKGSVGGATEKG
jgi:hypothetical protein